jgi:adenosine kinase
MAYASQISLKELSGPPPDLVVISPDDPGAMLSHVEECQEMGIPYIFDPSQQIVRLTAADVRKGIEGALALFVNDYECALIQKMTGMTSADLAGKTRFMVVTRGEKGASIFSGDQEFSIPVAPPERIADPTGVGDAFRGGFLTAYSHSLDWETCGRMGALAATYCLENSGPQGHSYTPAEFIARYRCYYDDQGKLDVLLQGK